MLESKGRDYERQYNMALDACKDTMIESAKDAYGLMLSARANAKSASACGNVDTAHYWQEEEIKAVGKLDALHSALNAVAAIPMFAPRVGFDEMCQRLKI